MGVYGNLQIKAAIDDGHIICVPFEPTNLNNTSLDVTLGYNFYRMERMNERTIYNPFDREDVERYFDGPYKAMPGRQWATLNGFKMPSNIPDDHPVISLKPRERILAHTHEFFGILPPGACEVRGRSSWARNGIAISIDAGWIGSGYINRLTLYMHNLNERETVVLPVGERIAQVVFHETGDIEGKYGEEQRGKFLNKYQQGNDVETIIRTWSPDMLLPQSYKDTRSMPRPIEGLSYD